MFDMEAVPGNNQEMCILSNFVSSKFETKETYTESAARWEVFSTVFLHSQVTCESLF
jgi:hypothetical protein